MANNGHCSTCQTHNIASTCGNKVESFKNLFGTQVEQNETYLNINNIIPHPKVGEIITKETWEQIVTILQAIKDYGELAEENPSQDKINKATIKDNNIILLDNYNSVLSALDQQQLSSSTIITKELIEQLEPYIKKYNINDTRCNICNTKCQNEQGCYCNCNCGSECGHCGTYYECYGGGGAYYYNSSTGNTTVTYYYSASIYKENIQDYIQNALDIINSTKIVEFNYITDPEKNQKIGFIADNTDAQLSTKNHNIMDVYNCIGILLKAVQELSQEIKELKEEKNA